MKQFVVGIAWSQTDHENVLVTAKNKDEAMDKVMKLFKGAHHSTGCKEIHHVIK